MVEDSPAHYVDANDAIYGVYDYDTGVPLPAGSKIVYRYTNGRLLFVMKFGPYNRLSVAYDGRHGKFKTTSDFRGYVDFLSDTYDKYYSAIKEEALRMGSSLKEIDHFILDQADFQVNPFLSESAQAQERLNDAERITILEKEEEYVSDNILSWNFSSVCMTSLSTFPNIRRSIPSFPINTSAETNDEKITENSKSWLADSPAASIVFLPIY